MDADIILKKYKTIESEIHKGQAPTVTHALCRYIMPLLADTDVLRLNVYITHNRPRCIHMDQILVNIVKEE